MKNWPESCTRFSGLNINCQPLNKLNQKLIKTGLILIIFLINLLPVFFSPRFLINTENVSWLRITLIAIGIIAISVLIHYLLLSKSFNSPWSQRAYWTNSNIGGIIQFTSLLFIATGLGGSIASLFKSGLFLEVGIYTLAFGVGGITSFGIKYYKY